VTQFVLTRRLRAPVPDPDPALNRLQLVLLPTEACNFRCTYCYERFGKERMSRDVVEGVKRLMSRRADGLSQLELSWFGGEPLLAFDIVEEVLVHACVLADRYPTLRVNSHMTTNGYLLDRSRANRLLELGVEDFHVSFGGPREAHDRTRVGANGKGTFDRVWGNILNMRESANEFQTVIRINLDQDNRDVAPDFLRQCRDALGDDHRFSIYLCPVNRLGGANDPEQPILQGTDRDRTVEELSRQAESLGLNLLEDAHLGSVCYAARPDSFVIRANGDLNKCSVHLYNEANRVGRLLPDGVLQIEADRLRRWTRGQATGDPDRLACPATGLLDPTEGTGEEVDQMVKKLTEEDEAMSAAAAFQIPSRRPDVYERVQPTARARARPATSLLVQPESAKKGPKSFCGLPIDLIDNVKDLDLGNLSKDPKNLKVPFSTLAVGQVVANTVGASIVPSAHGRMDEILIAIPHPDVDDGVKDGKKYLKQLIELLGADRKYTVVCHPTQSDTVSNWLTTCGNQPKDICWVRSKFGYSIWAQDPYVVLSAGSDRPFLCEGVLFTRFQDMAIADDVAAQANVSCIHSLLAFQGGNILATPDRVLIGEDYIDMNHGRVGLETETKVLDAFSELFGREVISLGLRDDHGSSMRLPDVHKQLGVGGWYQPIYHIDMHVTPTGVFEDGKEVVMVGRPQRAWDVLGSDGYGPLGCNDDLYRNIEEQLKKYFAIRQLPLLLQYRRPPKGAPESGFYHLSWNNVVIENYQDEHGATHRVVYMPTYGVEGAKGQDHDVRRTLDDAARDAWKDLKFEVKEIKGAEDLAYAQGSIHCMVKVLKRSGYVAQDIHASENSRSPRTEAPEKK